MYVGYEDEAKEVGHSVFDDLDNTKLLKSTQKVPEDTYVCTVCTMPMLSKIAAWHMIKYHNQHFDLPSDDDEIGLRHDAALKKFSVDCGQGVTE